MVRPISSPAPRPAQRWTTPRLDFLDLVTEVIDLRSFSNLWYWIVLAILWSSLSHWTLGVPYHVVARARRGDERAASDMRALAEINGTRILAVTDQSAPVLLGVAVFVATGLATTGWLYLHVARDDKRLAAMAGALAFFAPDVPVLTLSGLGLPAL
jgi:hypothetical protein